MEAPTDIPGGSAVEDASPAVRLLNQLVVLARQHRASDVHLEPRRDHLAVRWRVDGVLVDGPSLRLDLHPSLMARLKVLAELNLVERRRPQDGQFRLPLDDGAVDVRVATMPTVTGERAALRLTDVTHRRRTIADLGMPADMALRLQKVLRAPSGMVLCVGPTGAGKTTTLYAALDHLHDGTRHVATIEDPVEHILDGITQIQVHEPSGLTFSTGLRALLRHDPDVVLLGEIRDRETAQVAVQAALSGHLVLSTLHASDAVAALVRLVDLGVDRYLVATAVTAVIAQRLMRRLRPDSTEHYEGRVAVFEVVITSAELRRLISERVPADALRTQAHRDGLRALHLAAHDLVAAGVTSTAEVWRTLDLDEPRKPPL
jgi:type IV pilus assembly protein PilB